MRLTELADARLTGSSEPKPRLQFYRYCGLFPFNGTFGHKRAKLPADPVKSAHEKVCRGVKTPT